MKNNKQLFIYSLYGLVLKEFPAGKTPYREQFFSQREILNNATFTSNQPSLFIYNNIDQIEQINFKTYKVNYINTGSINSFTCSSTHLFIISDKGITSMNINAEKIEKNIAITKILDESLTLNSVLLTHNQLLIGINRHLYEFDTLCNYQKEYTNLNRNPVVNRFYKNYICRQI